MNKIPLKICGRICFSILVLRERERERERESTLIWCFSQHPNIYFKPFTPYHRHAYSPYWSPYISHHTGKENLENNLELLNLMISSWEFMTHKLSWIFCWAVKLLGEIRNRSLKLRKQKTDFHNRQSEDLSLFVCLLRVWRNFGERTSCDC